MAMGSSRIRGWRITLVDTLLFRGVMFFVSLLPQRIAVAAARRIGRAKYKRLRPMLDSQSANIQRRLQVGPAEATRILEESYELEACDLLEGAFARFRRKEKLLELTQIEGLEHLNAALERGKGALLYSGHVRGNFSFFAALGALGFRPNPIRLQLLGMQHPVKRWFSDRFNRLLEEKFDCRFLWTEPDSFGVAVQAANALRRNEVVLVLVDLSFSAQNDEVDFLGAPARFPTGPALIAKATGAPLLDYYIHRPASWTPQIVEIGPPVDPVNDTAEIAQGCATRLESHIRQYPAHWGPWLIGNWETFATWGSQAPWTFLREATNRF